MTQPMTAELLLKKAPLAGVDPDVKIPKAIRDAGARAEAIQQALTGQAEPTVLAPDGSSQNPPPASEQTPPPSDPPPPSAEGTFQVTPSPPVETPDWERQFKSMKGRYDQLNEQIGAMSEQLQRLQTENTILRQPAAPPPPGAPGAPPPQTFLTDQEVQDYGPEFIDVARRIAQEVAAPLHQEITTLRGQLGTVQQETSNAFLTRMHATIGGLVPNWEDINRDPSFIQWVRLPEIYSGVIRQQLMQDAWNNGDAQRVAAFFRAYLAEAAAVDPQGSGTRGSPMPPTRVATPSVVPLGTRLSLESLATPGRGHSGTQQPADKPVYTAQDITRFYTECAAGKWRTREAERAAIDADIIAAQHEGRIIPDQRTVRPTERNGHW